MIATKIGAWHVKVILHHAIRKLALLPEIPRTSPLPTHSPQNTPLFSTSRPSSFNQEYLGFSIKYDVILTSFGDCAITCLIRSLLLSCPNLIKAAISVSREVYKIVIIGKKVWCPCDDIRLGTSRLVTHWTNTCVHVAGNWAYELFKYWYGLITPYHIMPLSMR